MNNTQKLLTSTFAGIMGVAAMAPLAHAVPDQPQSWEKCAGIVKAGKNDCGALDGKHGCAGQSTLDNADNEWVYLPTGSCEKISGAVVKAQKPAKKS